MFLGLLKQFKKFGFDTYLYQRHANWEDLSVEI